MTLEELKIVITAETSALAGKLNGVKNSLKSLDAAAASTNSKMKMSMDASGVTKGATAIQRGMEAAAAAAATAGAASTAAASTAAAGVTAAAGATVVAADAASAAWLAATARSQAMWASSQTAATVASNAIFGALTKIGIALTNLTAAWPWLSKAIAAASLKSIGAVTALSTRFPRLAAVARLSCAAVAKAMTGMAVVGKGASAALGSAMAAVGGALAKVAKVALLVIGVFALLGTKTAIGMVGSINNLSYVLGENAQAFVNWANIQASAFGLSKASALNYGSTFATMIKGFASDTETAGALTIQMLQTSAVVAARTGRTVDDVLERMRSGMLGNTESVEDLGIYASQSAMEQTKAFKSMGKAWNDLTQSEKQQVLTLGLLEQAQKTYGNSMGGGLLTNLAIFKAELGNLGSAIGTAFLPILSVAVPALTALLRMLTKVAGVIATFFATLFGVDLEAMLNPINKALSGGSGAEGATAGIADNMGSAAKSAKQMNKALAGFDEINNLGKTDAAAGGSGAASGGAVGGAVGGGFKMEMPQFDGKFTQGISQAAEKVKGFLSGIRDFFKSIDFGPMQTALLGLWAVVQPVLLMLGQALGWIWDNILKPFIKWFVEVAAPKIITLAASIIAFLTPILAAIGKLIAWLWETVISPVIKWIADVIMWLVDKATIGFQLMSGAFGTVKEFLIGVFLAIAEKVGVVVGAIVNWFAEAPGKIQEKFASIKEFFGGIWDGIKEKFAAVGIWFAGVFGAAVKVIKEKFDGIKEFFGGIWDTIKSIFGTIGSAVGDAIGGAFKKVVNGILSTAESTLNGFVGLLNSAIKVINKIPGVNIGTVKEFSIPRLAKGGIVDSGQIYQAGEAGREAIVPLQRNTGWANAIADVVLSKMGTGGSGGSDRPLEVVLQMGTLEMGRAVVSSYNALAAKEGRLLLNI